MRRRTLRKDTEVVHVVAIDRHVAGTPRHRGLQLSLRNYCRNGFDFSLEEAPGHGGKDDLGLGTFLNPLGAVLQERCLGQARIF
jgi:hypothetical protein